MLRSCIHGHCFYLLNNVRIAIRVVARAIGSLSFFLHQFHGQNLPISICSKVPRPPTACTGISPSTFHYYYHYWRPMEREAKRKVRIGAIFKRNAEYVYRRAAEVSVFTCFAFPSLVDKSRFGAAIRISLCRDGSMCLGIKFLTFKFSHIYKHVSD